MRENAAAIFYDENLAIRTVESWKAGLTKQRLLVQKSAVARDFFLCRRMWVAWVFKSMEVKSKRLQEARETSLLKDALNSQSLRSLVSTLLIDDQLGE